ncbi:MAG: FAD-dependent oxidoreductase [Acetobacteraceae bacterium]
MARIGIIGAGIVGLACAHWLVEDGHQVTIVDRDPRGDKCSWGNAGGIAVTEVAPASMPGLIWRVPGWLIDPLGPLSVRPAHAAAMLPWLRRFLAAGRANRVPAIAAALASLNARVHDDLVPLLAATGLSHALRRVGALTVYETRAGFEHDRAEWDLRRQHGIVCEELTGEAAREMEPALGGNVHLGVFTPAWSQVTDPKVIWAGVFDSLLARGVTFEKREVVDPAGGDGAFDTTVIAAGAWSARLAARIGDRASLESERGYNTTLPEPGLTLTRQITFGEHKFIAAPLACGLRVGGAAEFAGLDAAPNFARSAALLALARRYLPALSGKGGTVWMGNRPTTPDSLPVIGRSPRRSDVIYAFGHGHLGLTQSATTGRLVADLVAGRNSGIDLTPFSIGRFSIAGT